MKATAKYDIGDRVWLISGNRAVRSDITRIVISIENPDKREVRYSLHFSDAEIPEDRLFSTKEELLKSL